MKDEYKGARCDLADSTGTVWAQHHRGHKLLRMHLIPAPCGSFVAHASPALFTASWKVFVGRYGDVMAVERGYDGINQALDLRPLVCQCYPTSKDL